MPAGAGPGTRAGGEDEAGLAGRGQLGSAPDDRFRPRPQPGPAQERRTLTVGMATYDDYDGVYFTVMSLLLYHAEAMERVNLLVVDNHPTGPHAWALKRLEQDFPRLRYIPYDRRVGTAARDRIFREAASDWVMCVDSHVQLAPGSLAALLEHINQYPDSDDLLQGPLVSADGRRVATHWEPRWERLWMYMRGGPGVFKGDLHFYRADGDFRDRVKEIDTRQCPLYLLTGEYDFSCTPDDTLRTAAKNHSPAPS